MQQPGNGFTLIELSIVLVIIGLIVGGVLVGQDLIGAAAVRAQISQIEKYNTAVNTFEGKYGALPGDMNAATAAQFGFTLTSACVDTRGGDDGEAAGGTGDGNGLIEGNSLADNASDTAQGSGEPLYFWIDLTYANGMNLNLIDGAYGANSSLPFCFQSNAGTIVFMSNVNYYFPSAKIGENNYLYVYANNGVNYFGLAGLGIKSGANKLAVRSAVLKSFSALTVQQAYSIDSKIDDGLPQSGNVLASYLYSSVLWAAGGIGGSGAAPGEAAPPSASSCYDNGGNSGVVTTYSISQNASINNCALSFGFQ